MAGWATRSAGSWRAARAAAVVGPTAARRTPDRARTSPSAPSARSTAVAEVNTSHEHSCTRAMAASRAAPPSSGSAVSTTGSRSTEAPADSSASIKPPAWVAARVTTTDVPESGPERNHSRSRPATAPMTMVAGDPSSTRRRSPRTVRARRWPPVVPCSITSTGVSGARPPCIRRSAISPRCAMPMSTTKVPPTAARAPQSTPSEVSSPTCPVTTVTEAARPRCVTGTPP